MKDMRIISRKNPLTSWRRWILSGKISWKRDDMAYQSYLILKSMDTVMGMGTDMEKAVRQLIF